METINLGKVAFAYKGDYNPATTYASKDVVFDGESSYISKSDGNVGNALSDATFWGYLAKGNAALSEQNAEEIDTLRADFNILNTYKANKVQEAWITPTLLNGWSDSGIGRLPRYYKDDFGVVHIEGMCANGVRPSVVFILPVGYRPPREIIFPSISGDVFAQIRISKDGSVIAHAGGAIPTWFSFNNIHFNTI